MIWKTICPTKRYSPPHLRRHTAHTAHIREPAHTAHTVHTHCSHCSVIPVNTPNLHLSHTAHSAHSAHTAHHDPTMTHIHIEPAMKKKTKTHLCCSWQLPSQVCMCHTHVEADKHLHCFQSDIGYLSLPHEHKHHGSGLGRYTCLLIPYCHDT